MRSLVFAAVLGVMCSSLVVAAPKPKPPKPPPPLPTITVCGHFVEGVECVLFAGDAGGLYIVGRPSTPMGECVCVTGQYDATCLSYCQQGDGCIYNATFTPCP